MNSQPILKTDEGIVLMTIGGRILRAAYDFGNSFSNRMGLNNYFQINGLNISEDVPITLLSWVSRNSTVQSVSESYQSIFNSNGKYYCNRFNPAGGINRQEYYSYIGNLVALGSMNKDAPVLFRMTIDKSLGSSVGKDLTKFTSVSPSESNILSSIWLGRDYLTQTIYSTSYAKFNRFVAYVGRALNENEISYFYNNRLGSDIQSSANLLIDIRFEKAEILDFSVLQNGSDMRVGCKDYSGNIHHAEMMNLPAGTLQQKLAYANANLFVPFL